MEMFNNVIWGALGKAQSFLRGVRYDEYFILAPLLMLALCCIARMICAGMTVLSPVKFSAEHRRTMYSTARTCYWISIVMQLLMWVFGDAGQLSVLANADYFAALLLAVTAVVSFLSAVLSMIFSRGGKRVFIAKSLNFSGLMLVLMAAFLAGFGMVFMQ